MPKIKFCYAQTTLVDGPYLQCQMDDESLWNCDKDGHNWRKVGPSNEELQKNFDEETKWLTN